ncbi:MAG: TonB-dependent receptor, partial [Pseudonocardiaceae bacterium]
FNRTFGPAWFSVVLGLPPDFPLPPRVSVINDLSTQDITSYGIFGEVSWSGFDERLKLSLSTRWQRDEIEQTYFALRQAVFPPFDATLDDQAGSASFNSLMPRLAATYRFTDDLTAYAVASKGVKPGGYNLGSQEVPNSPATFGKEELWNYEVGLKGDLLGRRLRYSLAVFHMDWKDIQVGQFFFDPVTFSGADLTVNGTAASSNGVELELTAALTQRLRLSAGMGYTDAKFDDFRNAIVSTTGDTADVTGNLLPLSTEWTANAAAEYRYPTGSMGDAFARVEYIYRGDTYDDIDNRDVEGDLIPAYDTWNLRFGLDGGRYSVVAFVDNVTDEEYVTGWLVNASESFTGVPGVINPRTYGVRMIARFQ